MRFCCIAQGTITSDGTRWRIMWKKKKKSNPGSLLGYFAVQQKLIEHCKSTIIKNLGKMLMKKEKRERKSFHLPLHQEAGTEEGKLFLVSYI